MYACYRFFETFIEKIIQGCKWRFTVFNNTVAIGDRDDILLGPIVLKGLGHFKFLINTHDCDELIGHMGQGFCCLNAIVNKGQLMLEFLMDLLNRLVHN